MSHRFFLDPQSTESIAAGAELTLDGDQAHHAIHVMRFQIGDEMVLFDGAGMEYRANVLTIAKKCLTVKVISASETQRSLKTKISIAVALPKGDRQKFLIEKLVELGIARLIPLKTTRSVAVANEKVTQRLRKQVVEASKQCGRNRLMIIGENQTLSQLAKMLDEEDKLESDSACRRLIADPYQGKTIAEFAVTAPSSIVIAIGPEGGFDDDENSLARDLGFEAVTLGPTILRVETAALAAAAIFGIGNVD